MITKYINKYIIIIIINIIIIRFFIIEPFRIPSGSMIPTLLPGDFIFVNKFSYGINVPFIKKNIIKMNKPERGDIIVFYHKNGKKYIKRVLGVQDDKITYINKQIIINGQKIKNKKLSTEIDLNENKTLFNTTIFKELISPKKEYIIQKYDNIDYNKYNYTEIKIPEKSYFVLGDNRDNSEDSRFWGFVEEKDIIGKAILIWISLDMNKYIIRLERINKKIK